MTDILPPRPTFSNGQYIGADDLNAAVEYARDETRRLAISARNWGIVTGLALVERTDAAGAIQMYIEPGIAWDGYGRPVVVLAPAPVSPDLFAGLKSNNQIVWLRYSAKDTNAIEPGFRTCGCGDPTTRVAETYEIVAGRETVSQQSDGIEIGGASVADPRDMLIAVDQQAPAVLDAAAAHQMFQGDDARWLIPVGVANYVAGAPGTFATRSPAQLVQDRLARRYVGLVAEQLLAADGVLRLRDRLTDQVSGDSDEKLARAIAVGETDVEPNSGGRLVGTELVWVEGKLRVTDDERIWGARLELRDAKGKEAGKAPLFLRRGAAENAKKGQDLQIAIGAAAGVAGQDRLTIGVLDAATTAQPDGVLDEQVVVQNDGRVAIGTNEIDAYDHGANQLVVASAKDAGVTVVSDVASSGNLFFADGTGSLAQKAGFVAYDHGTDVLKLGASSKTQMRLTGDAEVVIGPADPSKYLADADQLIVSSSNGPAGITIVGDKGTSARIDFAEGDTTPDAGFVRYDLQNKLMELGVDTDTRVWIDANGRVGVGTDSPGALIELGSDTDDHALRLDLTWVQVMKGGDPGTLKLNPLGGNVGAGLQTPNAAMHVRGKSGAIGLIVDDDKETAIRAADGKVSIGFSAGAQTRLDVKSEGASPSQAGVADPATHVAFFENTCPSTGPVLALRIDGPLGDWGSDTELSDFVTCLDANDNWLGGILGVNWGGGDYAIWQTGGGDYAEAVPRAAGEAAIKPGSVVGVKDGSVSLVTDGADTVLVTTVGPAVLGRAPPRGQRAAYETVALLGQVTVTVRGGARAGDLILPSGGGDGLGRAVGVDDVGANELSQVIGQAWATVAADTGSTAQVNVLVGPGVATAAASAALLRRQAREIEQLVAQLSALQTKPRRRPARSRA